MDEQNNFGSGNNGSFGSSTNASWQNSPNNGNNYGNGNGYGNNPNGQPYNDPNNYGQYNNGYGGNPYQQYPNQWDVQPNQKTGYGFAVASLVISLVNLFIFGTLLSFIALPLCILFTIIAFKKKGQGKGMAVAGLIISIISSLILVFCIYFFADVFKDMSYFVENEKQIIEEYHETGKVPDRFKKYGKPAYDKFWEVSGYDSFEKFFDEFIDEADGEYDEYDYDDDDDDDYDDDYDEEYDDDGEELVIL